MATTAPREYGQFTPQVMRRRRIVNAIMTVVFTACAIVILIPLVHILVYSVLKGASSINLNYFTKPPAPPGQPGGGVATALVGSGIILVMASALGIPYWKTVLRITVPAARSGIGTAVVLAFARVGGETAPLLFTVLGNNFFQKDIRRPIDALPLRLFNYAIGPYDEWHRIAWGSAFVLVLFILILMVLIRRIARGRFKNVV
jgi:ABC-type phosphate transport system permease subunit